MEYYRIYQCTHKGNENISYADSDIFNHYVKYKNTTIDDVDDYLCDLGLFSYMESHEISEAEFLEERK